jgi:hypothetical protein
MGIAMGLSHLIVVRSVTGQMREALRDKLPTLFTGLWHLVYWLVQSQSRAAQTLGAQDFIA